MAVVLNSLTPAVDPIVITNGTSIAFNATFTETLPLVITNVQWQVSIDGTTWNSAPFLSTSLVDNGDGTYQSSYNTGNLNASNNGDFYRIRITSSSGEIFDSVTRQVSVENNPSINVISETYNPFYIVPDNGTVVLDASATYLNRPVSLASDLAGLTITWQKSYNYVINPSTATWTNVTAGTVANEAVYTIEETTFIYDVPTGAYAKNSKLTITDIKFGLNQVYFRPVYTSSGVNNSPLESFNLTYVLVSPTISIVTQPGVESNNTTGSIFCYGSGNASNGVFPTDTGGDFRSTISAVTSASSSSTLTLQWQFRPFDDGISGNLNDNTIENPADPSPWENVINGQIAKLFTIQQSDSTLILRRLQYRDRYQFRCVINGSVGEPEVISNIHEVYMKDNITNIDSIATPLISLEDYYGNVANRALLTDKPIRNFVLNGILNIANYLGQEGNIEFQWQRKDPGSSTWNNAGTAENTSYRRETGDALNPGTQNFNYISTFQGIPLRINDGVGNQRDDGAEYRLRVRSSAVYTFNSGASYPLKKTLTPWYSNAVTLDVYKEIFITSQPISISAFPTSTASLSTNFVVTSNVSGITYKWQRANSVNNQPDLNSIVDISNGPLFGVAGQNVASGATGTGTSSSSIIISNVTPALTNYFLRTVISDPAALSSVTSDFARINVTEDKFTQISSINDYFVDEFSDVSWTVTASTLSQGAITYQWQKTLSYGSGIISNWTDLTNSGNIQGANTNTLNVSTVRISTDSGYYRLKMTSTGGSIAYSNVVRLQISLVEIEITQNLPNSFTFVEGETIATPFKITAFSSNGESITYQWQYKKVGDPDFVNFGPGQDFQVDTLNPYTPNPFFKQNNWDGAEVRCRLSLPSFSPGTYLYSNIATLDIKRRLYYFADSEVKTVSIGDPFTIELNPIYTGNSTPTFSWEYSSNSGSTWASVSVIGAVNNSSTLFLANTASTYDNYIFRCLITLNSLDQLVFTRNNIVNIQNSPGSGYTANVILNAVTGEIYPVYYTQENSKTGCAVGTVICIPKPAGYVDQSQTAVSDDIDQWEVSISGDPFQTGNVSSLVSSGNTYNTNKSILESKGYTSQNWINSSYKSPKWRLDKDRFPGFIELRGQWLLKSEFGLLYNIIGDAYGSTADAFKLPNPYGKKMMGTGAINSQTARTSVIPLYDPDGTSGGDRLVPGTIGGEWNYSKSRQLPPGSPSVSGEPDGTAGTLDPSTFTLGNYSTTGWDLAEAPVQTSFSGSFNYEVGPLLSGPLATPPPHVHTGSTVKGTDSKQAYTSCAFHAELEPEFNPTTSASGTIDSGPSYIASGSRGRPHAHGLSDQFILSGNNKTANEGVGKGDNTADEIWSDLVTIDARLTGGDEESKTLNSFLDQTNVTLSNTSKTTFDNNLSFYIRNSEPIPIISNYYRVKWLIKAY